MTKSILCKDIAKAISEGDKGVGAGFYINSLTFNHNFCWFIKSQGNFSKRQPCKFKLGVKFKLWLFPASYSPSSLVIRSLQICQPGSDSKIFITGGDVRGKGAQLEF